jgi:hypothetical protein
MEKQLTGWDKVGAAIRKRMAVSANTGRKPLSKESLSNLRGFILGSKNVDLPSDWIGRRPTVEELAGKRL